MVLIAEFLTLQLAALAVVFAVALLADRSSRGVRAANVGPLDTVDSGVAVLAHSRHA